MKAQLALPSSWSTCWLCSGCPVSTGQKPSSAQTHLSPVHWCSRLSRSLLSPVGEISLLPPLSSLLPLSTAPLKSLPSPLTSHPILHLLLSLSLPRRPPSFLVLGFTMCLAPLGCGWSLYSLISSLCNPLLHLSPIPHVSCKDFGLSRGYFLVPSSTQ